ncbi:MAG: L-2-hydroxyglutarate oxidase [Solirubrobacteraceae bacterium]|nr:L-2-hydroxyglutarate oxidase [Solirubrobacteraceae bacterium]
MLARRPGLRLAVLEREAAVGRHQTGHNSGVVHAGIYYAPGSLKARLAVEGARELVAYAEERGLPLRRCGKLIVAARPADLPRLDELERRAHANGVPGVRRLAAAEIREIEPHARGLAALHSPATAVVDFGAVAAALADDVRAAGGEIRTGTAVHALRREGGRVRVALEGGALTAGAAVACAGLWADRLAVAGGGRREPAIVPFRGAYRALRPERAHLVKALIYPVPDPDLPFLGVHLTRDVHDEVHVGPTALLAPARDAYRLARLVPRDLADTARWPGTWRVARRWWRTGLREAGWALRPGTLAREAARFVPDLRPADLVAGPAGVRAQAVARDGRLLDDFALDADGPVVHVRNAPSPAATASLALARVIADRLPAAA